MKIVWAVMAALFTCVSVVAGHLSANAFRAHAIELRLDDWSLSGFLSEDTEWQELFDESIQLVENSPFNPRHLENLLRLLDWRGYLRRLAPDTDQENPIHMGVEFRKLSRLVPTSGYPWAGIAETEARQGRFAGEAVEALEKAMLLHPAEDLSQRRVIRIGIEYWYEWPDSVQEKIKNLVSVALKTDTTLQAFPIDEFIFSIALQNSWENELIELIPNDASMKKFEGVRNQQ